MTRRGAFARAMALSATALILLSTSRSPPECPPESGLVSGPVALAVESTCGPPGVITATLVPSTPDAHAHDRCTLRLEGAADVGLAPYAFIDWAFDQHVEFFSTAGDQCTAWETQSGVFTLRCYDDVAGGCGRDMIPICEGTIRLVRDR